MTPEIEKLENSIKKTHRIGFTPQFKEIIQTSLSNTAFIALGLKAIENIGWEIVFYDETTIEAVSKGKRGNRTEGIIISYDYGKVTVKSSSLGDEMWDQGRNSKRVKLFQLVFSDLEQNMSREEVREIEQKQKKKDQWEEYTIPQSLPEPTSFSKPTVYVPLFGSLIFSLLLGFILAFSITNGVYIIGLFDVGCGFLLGVVLTQTMAFGNYTNFNKLRPIFIVSLVLSFISCQLFIYQLSINGGSFRNIDFISFMKLRFEAGLKIKNINTGWIGLIISWGLFLFLGYFVGLGQLARGIVKQRLKRVPTEVLDFAMYLLIKNNSESKVKEKLSELGWKNPEDQEYVFEAISAIQDAQEMNRS